MKLTREQREKLDKLPIKERVVRLEELTASIIDEVSRIRQDSFDKEMEKIEDDANKKAMWGLCIWMILLWVFIWVLAVKLLS